MLNVAGASAQRGLSEAVVRDIDLGVQPGQCVAILGATGAGKSVLMSLIPRFFDPTAGRLLIDGIDARQIHLDDLRRNIGLVFQESFLFSNTIAANIAFGHPGATREQIEKAARIAAAHEFITRMPQGYDTVLGEGGSDLARGDIRALLKMLVEANFAPSRLDIEVTESCLHENLGLVRSIITSLQNQGVTVSLDDFGTGYSSLSQLRSLPFNRELGGAIASRNTTSWSTPHALISVRLLAVNDGGSARAATLRGMPPFRAASARALCNVTWMLRTDFGDSPFGPPFS